ncbi:hypothetical protein NGM37_36595 [Streptomyces sp. TRM76130]|nr:hypothetical protein [Streptomyces sp. TRM76130]
MRVRCATKARRGAVALAIAAGMAMGVAGCGGDDKTEAPSSASSEGGGSKPSTQENTSAAPLAELKGPDGLLLTLTSAQRDSGGFVTVSGALKNDGGETTNVPAQLSGNETEIIRNGSSLGGAALVDAKGKKRYYVLRDTDGRPLTTTNFPALKAGESVPVFMQFPAPPADTTEVTFQLPMFSAATLTISG